jgi:UDP-N-acetylmuramoyl-tripeptide--D-alanyl-D-alanine ligase
MNIDQLYTYFLKCEEVSTDSRFIKKDSIFFALKGNNFDGNDYALDALNKGAKYAIIDNSDIDNSKFIKVKNVLKTLQKLSSHHRKQLINTTIIAITGSNGKTTSKELMNCVFSFQNRTKSTIGNLNNHIGVPLTLLGIKKTTEYAIVEMGANHLKEISFLTNLVKPDIGYITNFGKAHLEGFGSLKGVIKGKTELFDWLIKNNKPILINADNEIQYKYKNKQSITFSDKVKSDYIFSKSKTNDSLLVSYKDTEINSKLIGDYNFSNISAAIALGLYFNIPILNIKKAIESYVPKNNRSQVIKKNNQKIILDAYNANPSSMLAALDSFLKLNGTKAVILGDMFELGEESNSLHLEIVNYCFKNKINKVFLIGSEFYKVRNKESKLLSFETKYDFEKYLKSNDIKENNILIKGSRVMKMEEIVEMI